MIKILLITLLFFITNLVFGQHYNLPNKNFFRSAKVSLIDFHKFEATNLKILNDSIQFTNKYTKTNKRISLQDVNYLRVQTGNQMGEWALYGGLLMGLSVLYAVVDINSDPYREMKDNAGAIIAGFMVGGVVIGGLIGATIPKWKTYYVNSPTGFINTLKPDLYIGQNSIGIKIQLTMN